MKKAVVVLGDALGSTAATSSEGAPIEVREVPLANFCCLVQHAESHEDELECFIASALSGNTAAAERVLADLDSLSPKIQSTVAAELVAAFSDARAELRAPFARMQDSQCSLARLALHGPPVGCAGSLVILALPPSSRLPRARCSASATLQC